MACEQAHHVSSTDQELNSCVVTLSYDYCPKPPLANQEGQVAHWLPTQLCSLGFVLQIMAQTP